MVGSMGVNRGGVVAGMLLAGAVIGGALGAPARIGGPAPLSLAQGSLVAPRLVRVVVHVAGWVAHPGVVEVPEGSLVADAIAMSGGARPGARIDALNLARVVVDGDRIEVPGPSDPVGSVRSGESELISLNRADAEALQKLPGVGPVLADRIVAYREANGPFERIEDLLQVPGIGETKLASIRDLVAVP